jgi:hypothetical protein
MQGAADVLEEELNSTVYDIFRPENDHLYEDSDYDGSGYEGDSDSSSDG